MKPQLVAVMAAVGTLASLPAAAQFAKPEDAVKYRQSAMYVMANHVGRIGAMVQGKAPFDAAQAQANAEVVVAMSKLPFVGFVEGTSSTEKGKAAAQIWSERAKFDEAARKMQDEVGKLLVATRSSNLDTIKAAFGPVGQSCKGCHDEYRNQQ